VTNPHVRVWGAFGTKIPVTVRPSHRATETIFTFVPAVENVSQRAVFGTINSAMLLLKRATQMLINVSVATTVEMPVATGSTVCATPKNRLATAATFSCVRTQAAARLQTVTGTTTPAIAGLTCTPATTAPTFCVNTYAMVAITVRAVTTSRIVVLRVPAAYQPTPARVKQALPAATPVAVVPTAMPVTSQIPPTGVFLRRSCWSLCPWTSTVSGYYVVAPENENTGSNSVMLYTGSRSEIGPRIES